MGWILKLFGGSCRHEFTGYAGGVPYVHYTGNRGVTDGLKRQHIDLYARCDKCDREILIAKMHVQENSVLYGHSNSTNTPTAPASVNR